MPIPYACIDTGYIYDPAKKLDNLMSDFYEAENSQSYLFTGHISSFPYIIQMYERDPEVVVAKFRDTLTKYLGKYFDTVAVEAVKADSDSSTSYDLRARVVVTQDDITINFHDQLRITGTSFEKSQMTRQ